MNSRWCLYVGCLVQLALFLFVEINQQQDFDNYSHHKYNEQSDNQVQLVDAKGVFNIAVIEDYELELKKKITLIEPLMRIFFDKLSASRHRNKRRNNRLFPPIRNRHRNRFKRPPPSSVKRLIDRQGYYGSGSEYFCCESYHDLLSRLALLSLSGLLLFLIVLSTTTTSTTTSTTTMTTTPSTTTKGAKGGGGRRRRRSNYQRPDEEDEYYIHSLAAIPIDINDHIGVNEQGQGICMNIKICIFNQYSVLSDRTGLVLDAPTWLSMIDELWNDSNDSCTLKALCRMNRLALETPGSAGIAVSFSRFIGL